MIINSTKKLLSALSIFSLVGCNGAPSELLINVNMVREVGIGKSIDIPAAQILPDTITYICSLGPYFDTILIDPSDSRSQRMLEHLSILPVDEHQGYFVYFDEDKNLVSHDALFDRKDIRWSSVTRDANTQVDGKCLEVNSAIIQIDNQDNVFHIGLKQTTGR